MHRDYMFSKRVALQAKDIDAAHLSAFILLVHYIIIS
jgi:hypothetical protein